MKKEQLLHSILPSSICMNPDGFQANELSTEQLSSMLKEVIPAVLSIHTADVSGTKGYGTFGEDGQLPYLTCHEFLTETFNEEEEGYWYHWRNLFETSILERHVFDQYYAKMKETMAYCEGKRYLFHGAMWFQAIITDGIRIIGFPDWSRAGIGDFLLDFATLDLHKPFLKIPERLYQYCKEEGIQIPDFKERFLCMAYYRQIDALRWHASIDDKESYKSIKKSLSELEQRITNIK